MFTLKNKMINRHAFEEGSISYGKESWSNYANLILDEEAIVNIGATADINTTNRNLKIKIEIYYTGSQNLSTNKLNVALLQSNIQAPQSNYTNANEEDYLENGNYLHNHVLRHLITGQWGEEITSIDEGSLIELEYNYIIEEDYNDIVVN